MRAPALTLCIALAAAGTGSCASKYVTPGAAARLDRLRDGAAADAAVVDRVDVLTELQRAPAAHFPARLAIARVQAPGYVSHSQRGGSVPGLGFSVMTVNELLDDEQLSEIAQWIDVAGAAPLNRMLLPDSVRGVDDLRVSAAKLQADMLLLYTIDTRFEVRRKLVLPTGVISLGLAPEDFWALTLNEWRFLAPDDGAALSRGDLDRLIALYPDEIA